MTNNSERFKVLTARDGSVINIAKGTCSEREIAEDQEVIVEQLHDDFLNLLENIEEFQSQWESSPSLALLKAAKEGIKADGDKREQRNGNLFDETAWTDLGEKIKRFAERTYEAMAFYSEQQYEELRGIFEDDPDLLEDSDEPISNWAWWQSTIDREVDAPKNGAAKATDSTLPTAVDHTATVIDPSDWARKLPTHQDAILNLPVLIATADVDGLQKFVRTVLHDIDPRLAKALEESSDSHIARALIADHESTLNYVAYLALTIEAAPPNFYVCISAKLGMQLLLEAVLIMGCAFLTSGAGVPALKAVLADRLVSSDAKLSSRRTRTVDAAMQAYDRMLKGFMRAARDLRLVGEKLHGARVRGVVSYGREPEYPELESKVIKRDSRCRLCGSPEHSTPRMEPGTVTYE